MNSDDPVAPYETLVYHGNSIKLDTKGKTVVVPTGNPTLLPLFNEYVENADRLTTAESPFGGMKGSYPPDYAVGTVYTPTEGIYLTDTSGTNSTKTLTAGKLTELGLLTVDTSAHTFTEEFIIRNDNEGSDVTVIDPLTSGWAEGYATGGTITYANGVVTNTDSVCDASGRSVLMKSIGLGFLLGKAFLKFTIVSNTDASLYCLIVNPASSTYKLWAGVRFPLTGNVPTTFVLPVSAPVASTGANPSSLYEQGGTFDMNNISRLYIGVAVSAGATVSYSVTDVKSCNGTWAQVEVAVPDNLQMRIDGSRTIPKIELSAYNGTGYGTDINFYDGANYVFRGSVMPFLDGTSSYHIFGANKGGIFTLPGNKGETVSMAQSYTDLPTQLRRATLSNLYGTKKRFVLALFMPPSDNGRTNLNKCRLKLVTYYDDTNGNTVPDLSGNGNTGTIVGGVTKLNDGGLKFDGSTGYVDCGNPAALNTNNFTIITTVIPTTSGYIYDKNVSAYNNGEYLIQYDLDNQRVLSSIDYYASNITSPPNSVPSGVSACIVQRYDSSVHSLFINNVKYTVNYSATRAHNSSNFVLGTRNINTGNFGGTIQKIRVYNRALSDTEVTAAYNNQYVDPTGLVIGYVPTVSNMGSTTYEFADSTNASYGLHHMVKPWIALLEDDTQEIDFYLFDERPKNLKYKQDESGKIYELEVFPGNGNCYHGLIKYSGLTRDTNSDGIPDCLDPSVEGSIANFLRTYDFAKDWYYEYDLSASAISVNDFSITEESLDIVPFAVPEGDSVSDENNVVRPVVETVAGADGNISIYDVKGLDTVRVRDTPYTNAGECKVFDTVTAGNTTESTWIRVYRTDWVFTGDCIVENGIVRTRFGGQTYFQNPSLYRYNSGTGTYTKYNGYHVMAQAGIVGSSVKFITFSKFTTDEIIVIAESTYGGYYASYTLSINRGSPHVKIISTAQLKFEPTATVSTRRGRFATNGTLLDDAELTSTSSTLSGSWGATLDPADTFMRVFTQTEGSFTYYWNDTYKKYNSIFQSTHVPNKQKTIAAIPYSPQMYWEAEALTLSGGATLAEDASAYPFTGNSAIRCTATANVALSPELGGASGQYTIFVRVKGNAVNQKCRFYVYDYTTSSLLSDDTQVNVTETYTIISKTFTKVAEHVVKFVLRGLDGYDINYDYVLVVPTGLIETQAKRALWNASPMTSTLKSSKR